MAVTRQVCRKRDMSRGRSPEINAERGCIRIRGKPLTEVGAREFWKHLGRTQMYVEVRGNVTQ